MNGQTKQRGKDPFQDLSNIIESALTTMAGDIQPLIDKFNSDIAPLIDALEDEKPESVQDDTRSREKMKGSMVTKEELNRMADKVAQMFGSMVTKEELDRIADKVAEIARGEVTEGKQMEIAQDQEIAILRRENAELLMILTEMCNPAFYISLHPECIYCFKHQNPDAAETHHPDCVIVRARQLLGEEA